MNMKKEIIYPLQDSNSQSPACEVTVRAKPCTTAYVVMGLIGW